MAQYKSKHVFSLESSQCDDISIIIQTSKPIVTQAEEYKTTFVVCQKLATQASEVSMTRYQSRLDVLHHLAELWEMDKDQGLLVLRMRYWYNTELQLLL